MQKLKKGIRVNVYAVPSTKAKLEGVAVLVSRRLEPIKGEPTELWFVRFDGEHESYERWVSASDIVTAKTQEVA